MNWSRRRFLAASAAALAGNACATPREGRRDAEEPSGPLIDFHVHLFGVGHGGTGCYVSERQRRHPTFPFLVWLMRLEDDGNMDENYVQRLAAMLRASSIDRAVLLAQDSRYDDTGRADPESTPFYVPNDYLLRVVERFPDLFIPCVSINPKRGDALEEVERCAANGARLLKIHPPIQDVDPAEERFRPFYRRCAERGVILMFHTGTEHAAEIVGNEFSDPARLTGALEQGCTVIASHSGFGSVIDEEDFLGSLLPLIRRFPNFYCDTAALALTFRWRSLPQVLEEPEVVARLIHASDVPFPSDPLVFWRQLSYQQLFELSTEQNLLERDYRLKLALGVPAEVFERGARLLRTGATTGRL